MGVIDVEDGDSVADRFTVDADALLFAMFEHYASLGEPTHGTHISQTKFLSFVGPKHANIIDESVSGLGKHEIELLFIEANRDSHESGPGRHLHSRLAEHHASSSPKLATAAHGRELDFDAFCDLLADIGSRMPHSLTLGDLVHKYLVPLAEREGREMHVTNEQQARTLREVALLDSAPVAKMFKECRTPFHQIFEYYAVRSGTSALGGSRSPAVKGAKSSLGYEGMLLMAQTFGIVTDLVSPLELKTAFYDVKAKTERDRAAGLPSADHTSKYHDMLSFTEFERVLALVGIRHGGNQRVADSLAILLRSMEYSGGRDKLAKSRNGVTVKPLRH